MYYFLELFLILTIFVLPPIFTTESPTLGFVEFNLFHFFIYGFLGIYCFIRSKSLSASCKTSENQHILKKEVSKILLLSIITLFLLFGNGFFWQWISKSQTIKVDYSKGVFGHIFQILGLGLYAFYEENMYRNYLQGLISKFLENMVKSPINKKSLFAKKSHIM